MTTLYASFTQVCFIVIVLFIYSTHPLIRTRKGLSSLFQLANVPIIGNSEEAKEFDVPPHVLYSYNIHIGEKRRFCQLLQHTYNFFLQLLKKS